MNSGTRLLSPGSRPTVHQRTVSSDELLPGLLLSPRSTRPRLIDHRSHSSEQQSYMAFRQRIRQKPWRLISQYAVDWIVSIVLGFIFFYLGRIKGFRRHFSLTDTSIQFPYAVHERVPDWALAVISFVSPLVLIPVVNVATTRSFEDLHVAWLGLVVSLALTGSITNVVKVTVGRPRPDLIDRCQPRAGSMNAPVFGLATDAICTSGDTSIMNDGWRSFPSGHSSLSFAGLGFLTFYVAGKLHLWDKVGSAVKSWITITPLVGAALVAITRTMDSRHHWQDVLAGSALGLVVSFYSYRQYFPSLRSPSSHVPLPPPSLRVSLENELPRSDESEATHLPMGFSDEEQGAVHMELTAPSPGPGTNATATSSSPRPKVAALV